MVLVRRPVILEPAGHGSGAPMVHAGAFHQSTTTKENLNHNMKNILQYNRAVRLFWFVLSAYNNKEI